MLFSWLVVLVQQDYSTLALDDLVRMRNMMMQETNALLTPEDGITSDTATPDILSSGNITPEPFRSDPKDIIYTSQKISNTCGGGSSGDGDGDGDGDGSINQSLTSRLVELASKVTQLSSTEDELDRADGEDEGRQSRESIAREALWDMEVEGQAEATADGERDISSDRLAEMDIDMEEVREEGERYILSVRAKVLEQQRARDVTAAPVEQTWWESLSGLSGGDRERRPSAYVSSDAEYDSQSEGLDESGSIDEILSDMVRSSEIEIEKSAESWDRIEAMDVEEDRAEEEVRDRDRQGSVEVETAKREEEARSASKGDARYDRDNNRLLPSEWLRGDDSELAEKLRRSYRRKGQVFGREERKSKEYEHKGTQQACAKPCAEPRALLGRAQAQHVEVSEGQKPGEAFQAVEVLLDGSGLDSKVSSEEVGEGVAVKENQQPREEETPPLVSQGEKPGEKETTGLKMATVSGKVAGSSGTSGLGEESSSSDLNPYPSPDDINKVRSQP